MQCQRSTVELVPPDMAKAKLSHLFPAWLRPQESEPVFSPKPFPNKEETARHSCRNRQQAASWPHEHRGPAGTRRKHQVQGEAQAASYQLGTMSGTSTGATRSSDSDVQTASLQLEAVFGVSRRRSGLALAWRRRLRPRDRLHPKPTPSLPQERRIC